MDEHNDSFSPATDAEKRELHRWQRRLLPFMVMSISGLGLVYFVVSAWHVKKIEDFVEVEHGDDIRSLMTAQDTGKTPTIPLLTPEQAFQRSLLVLEADALDRRYHQATALLMSRILIKQLAFMTGMVMAFLGATFILGKLSESQSQISGELGEAKTAFSSSSPGITLAFLGTVLLLVSLLVQTTITVHDSPVYVYGTALRPASSVARPGSSAIDSPKPPDIITDGTEAADSPHTKSETSK